MVINSCVAMVSGLPVFRDSAPTVVRSKKNVFSALRPQLEDSTKRPYLVQLLLAHLVLHSLGAIGTLRGVVCFEEVTSRSTACAVPTHSPRGEVFEKYLGFAVLSIAEIAKASGEQRHEHAEGIGLGI